MALAVAPLKVAQGEQVTHRQQVLLKVIQVVPVVLVLVAAAVVPVRRV